MKTLRTALLAALVCVTAFTLAISVHGQDLKESVIFPRWDRTTTLPATEDHVYPIRINNYCLMSDATVSASSTANASFPASSAIDGDRLGQNCAFSGRAPCWGNRGGWNDGTRDIYPDWLRIDFGRARSVGRVVVVNFQDNFSQPSVEPYLGYEGPAAYGLDDYYIEVLTPEGSWAQVAEAEEVNLSIIQEFNFFPVLGTAVRITITDAYGHYSRIVEFEAYAS